MKRNRYTVWDAHTDEVLIVCGTARECAARLDISRSSFYTFLSRCQSGAECPYYIMVEVCEW